MSECPHCHANTEENDTDHEASVDVLCARCKEQMKKTAIEVRDWQEFKDSGMLWLTNRFLQLFGWAIVVQVDSETGLVLEEKTVAARSHFRGMSPEMDAKGFAAVTHHIAENIEILKEAVKTDDEEE